MYPGCLDVINEWRIKNPDWEIYIWVDAENDIALDNIKEYYKDNLLISLKEKSEDFSVDSIDLLKPVTVKNISEIEVLDNEDCEYQACVRYEINTLNPNYGA